MLPDGLKDLLPTTDGSTRRRLLSGFTVASTLVLLLTPGKIQDLKFDGLSNPTVALATVLIMYAIGIVVEIFGQTIFFRAFGGAMWAAEFPVREIHARVGVAKWTLRLIAYYTIVPFYAYWGALRAVLGRFAYRFDVARNLLTEEARDVVNRMPEIVQRGLTHPYGDDFDSAWELVMQKLSDANRAHAEKLLSRNRDILALLSSLVVAVCTAQALTEKSLISRTARDFELALGNVTWHVPEFGLPVLLLAPLFLFFVYHRYLMSTIVTVIELQPLSEAPAKT